ncbi:MAG: type III-B CRISPR module RAMP protein Cmr1, partial [Anaerolineae bacterium]
MNRLHVTLETVTPLFLGGADPRGAPELRAPSFRGALRYWLRALLGAAGAQSMRQHEDRLFGVGGDQAAAGAISLHLGLPSRLPVEPYSSLVNGRVGMGYLWFAARRTRTESERYAIMPSTFTIKLSSPRSSQPKRDLEQAASVLWLMTRLGGI